jgi:phage shock protein A
LLAQDVEALVPEIVTEDSTGLKRVDYAKLVPVLIKAVQELSEANEQLRSDVRDLKAKLEETEK